MFIFICVELVDIKLGVSFGVGVECWSDCIGWWVGLVLLSKFVRFGDVRFGCIVLLC